MRIIWIWHNVTWHLVSIIQWYSITLYQPIHIFNVIQWRFVGIRTCNIRQERSLHRNGETKPELRQRWTTFSCGSKTRWVTSRSNQSASMTTLSIRPYHVAGWNSSDNMDKTHHDFQGTSHILFCTICYSSLWLWRRHRHSTRYKCLCVILWQTCAD